MPAPITPIAKPAFNLTQSIRNYGAGLGGLLIGKSNAVIHGDKVVNLSMRPLGLLLLAAGGLVYRQAEQNTKSDGDPKRWMKDVGQSSAYYVATSTSKGVLPIYGLISSLYQAGQAHDTLTKIQTVTKNLMTIGLGYLGVVLGYGMTDAIDTLEDRMIQEAAKNTEVQQFVQKTLATGTHEPLKELAKLIQAQEDTAIVALRNNIVHTKQLAGEKLTEAQIGKLVRQEIEAQRRKAIALLSDAAVKESLLKHSRVNRLLSVMRNSQEGYIQLVRTLNPVLVSVIMTTLVGIPLIRYANTFLAQKFPDLAHHSVDVFKEVPPKNAGGGHGGGGGSHGGGGGHGLPSGPKLVIPQVGTGVLV